MIGAWRWLKKYWKWIVFPVGLTLAALAWLSRSKGPELPATGTTDEAADEAMAAYKAAARVYQEKVREVHKKVEERLKTASEEQLKEYEELKDKPIEEIAKWIDDLA